MVSFKSAKPGDVFYTAMHNSWTNWQKVNVQVEVTEINQKEQWAIVLFNSANPTKVYGSYFGNLTKEPKYL